MKGVRGWEPDIDGPAPRFSLADAERIVRRLAPAMHEHSKWVQRIHTILICREVPDGRGFFDDNDVNLQLGHWFAEEPNEYIRRHPSYLAAAERYRQVHELARSLCEAVARNRPVSPPEYQAFAEAIQLLERNLETIVKEAWDLLRFTDPLTGIATRSALIPRLREEHARVQRTGIVSSVCMVDLDYFKSINDTFGHHVGDMVLEAVSSYFVRNLRRYDQVCRYGGEEFVILLPDTPPDQAAPIIDRLRRGMTELAIPAPDGRRVWVTASFGIAPLVGDASIQAAIEDADRAMYEAKRAGRNQVRVHRSLTNDVAKSATA